MTPTIAQTADLVFALGPDNVGGKDTQRDAKEHLRLSSVRISRDSRADVLARTRDYYPRLTTRLFITGTADIGTTMSTDTAESELAESALNPSRPKSKLVLPRLVRLRDAALYLGMDKNRFNREVRQGIREIPIGRRGVAFDRIDLDAWADDHKRRNGRPATQSVGRKSWAAEIRQVSPSVVVSGTSISSTEASAFARALERATSRKRRSTSPSE